MTKPEGPTPAGRVTITVPTWVAALRDPGVQAAIALGLLAVAGLAMFAFAWRGGARTVYVPLQLPWLVSGGIAGFGVLGVALASLHIHLSRRDAAAHRLAMEQFMRDAVGLTEQLRAVRGQRHPRRSG